MESLTLELLVFLTLIPTLGHSPRNTYLAPKGGYLDIFYCSLGSLGTKENIKVVKGYKNNEMKKQTKPLRFFPWARTVLININVPQPKANLLPISMCFELKIISFSIPTFVEGTEFYLFQKPEMGCHIFWMAMQR